MGKKLVDDIQADTVGLKKEKESRILFSPGPATKSRKQPDPYETQKVKGKRISEKERFQEEHNSSLSYTFLDSLSPFSSSKFNLGRFVQDLLMAMQSQLVCNGCRTILLYPRGAANVCCAVCNVVTSVPPPGLEMSQLICGGCRTLLMYTRGASSVRCSCCHTVNLVPASGQVAHVNCCSCRTTLMYPYGAPSVKCAVCHCVTNVNMGNARVPIPALRPGGAATSASTTSTSPATPRPQNQTVVVQNPMSVDESGKLVSNVVVGVTT
ncbi:hypothetical protein ACET3Z_007878 [Daucus carota]